MATTGTLHMLTSTSASEALYLQLPESTDLKVPEVIIHSARDTELGRDNTSLSRSYTSQSLIDKDLTRTMRIKNCDDGFQRRMRKTSCRQNRGSSLAEIHSLDDFRLFNFDLSGIWAITTSISQFPSVDRWLKRIKSLYRWRERGRSDVLQEMEDLTQRSSEVIIPEISRSHKFQTKNSGRNPLSTVSGPMPPPPSRVSISQSLEIGSTGMFISLIDLNQHSTVASNISSSFPESKNIPNMNPNLIQVIGESALPLTFKALQRDAARESTRAMGLNTVTGMDAGGVSQLCRFSIYLEEAPMATAVTSAREEQDNLFDQLMPSSNINKSIANNDTQDVVSISKEDALIENDAYATSVSHRFS